MNLPASNVFSVLPEGLRTDLIGAFNEIARNYREHRWEPAELNGGKLCEAVFTVVDGYIKGQYARRSSKPNNFPDACRALERNRQTPRSIRIQIPRMLVALYEIRNNRGVGHAGSDVNPNQMDATVVLYMSKWLMAELVRVLHTLTTKEATKVVDALIEREIPMVWSDGSNKRILATNLTRKQQVLLLLLLEPGESAEDDLMRWLEVGNRASFRRDVLRPLHRDRFIEFDPDRKMVRLLPPGVTAAEIIFP
ncbi:hypothetical protein [Streptomyces hainanensis]|uniref:Uncharacterized protein n=1 Tax=Streptomyces hainanensis TaxID=402648 RepID=A0A4R4SKD6_9ACTN|nr:hypothetical protein [Streptomyces hainanensis]TDC62472.1 hypothetical protein E1283_34015 [Streptomyces hainanensis]